MSARTFLEAFFEVDEDGIILDQGPFQGEPIYIPYYWDLYRDKAEAPIIKIRTTIAERNMFPELEDRDTIFISEWPDGRIQETDEILI